MREIPTRANPRVSRWTRTVVVAAATCVAIGAAAAPPSNGRTPAVGPEQELVTLLTTHQAVSALTGATPSTTRTVAARRPVTGTRTVLPVLDRTTAAGVRWLRVLLPGRPNGSTGWIRQEGTAPAATIWRLVIRTSSRRVLVYRRGRLVESFAAVVGKPSTPTPHGRFFVEESVRMPRGSAGAPYALALSAHSNVLQEFDGGPGQIAIHGVANLGGTPGTAVSHGCIRLDDRSIRWLAARAGPGAPVTIRP